MKRGHGFAVPRMMLAVLCVSVLIAGDSQAQTSLSAFTGKFKLTNPVVWGDRVLRPGDYTVTLRSSSTPAIVLISDSNG